MKRRKLSALSESSPIDPQSLAETPRLLFESGSPGRTAFYWPAEEGHGTKHIPDSFLRDDIPGFPELGELEVLRHFTRLSQRNFGIEGQFYPLGSCKMKYNPKVNEIVARLPGFAQLHPLTPVELLQGAMELLYKLERMLTEISGMDHVSLQPSAGAQGELTGLMLIRAYLAEKGNPRKKIIVPDTAHGTNPASSTLCGYDVVQISSNAQGVIDPATVEKAMNEEVAALMVTNPNTLGIFEKNIVAVAEIVHGKGGMLYLDGANLNAIMGRFRPGEQVVVTGFDLGMNTAGGFGQYIRVPSAWAVRLPPGLTLKESMALGTAGFTAGLSVWKLAVAGVRPDDGDILVTGATGGVGSIAVAVLDRAGYRVVAATGKAAEADYLRRLGAAEVIDPAAVEAAYHEPRSPAELEPLEIGREAAERAVSLLGAEKPASRSSAPNSRKW